MAPPFVVRRQNGMVFIETGADQAFRKALRAGVPPSVRAKMNEALAATPDSGAMAHSVRYFGDELADIKNRIAPLLIGLNKYLTKELKLPGLFDWLNLTNYGNDYRMIKAFAAWAEMAKTSSLGVVGEEPKKILHG